MPGAVTYWYLEKELESQKVIRIRSHEHKNNRNWRMGNRRKSHLEPRQGLILFPDWDNLEVGINHLARNRNHESTHLLFNTN